MLNETETESATHYLPSELSEPVWITDPEGELVFFAMIEDGQVTEWVWL